MSIKKPKAISADKFKSAKWDEIVAGRNYTESDIPNIVLLCNWHAIINACIEDISDVDGVHVAYQNENGDLRALPQISTMSQASREIRALNKLLGINESTQEEPKKKETVLHVIQKNRQSRTKNKTGS